MNKWKKLRKQNLGQIPTEASTNLVAPEATPLRKNIKANIRTKPLNFKVSEEFYWQLKELALKEKHLMVEVVEKSLECYKQHCSKVSYSSNKERGQIKQKSVPKPTQKLNQFWKVNFICDKCQRKFEKSIVYSLAPDLDELNQYPTYCADCGENKPEFCSFWTEANPEPCSHFIFDKKKQLCRSHNKQVWKKFHEFLKEESVSSTASWYEVWNQSGDWRYFWNLTKEKNK